MLDAMERETVITGSDGDGLVRVWTAQRRFITRLKRDAGFTLEKEGTNEEGQPWAEFIISAADWNPSSGSRKKRDLSDEERKARAERLSKARAARATPTGDKPDPMKRACPKCKVKKGKACLDLRSGGKKTSVTPHKERMK